MPSGVWPANEPGVFVEDTTALGLLSEATLLENMRIGLAQSRIYQWVGPILVALNPMRPLPELYNEAVRKKAKVADLYDPFLEPHIYHVAEKVRASRAA